jgi:hypothetical protein
LTDNSGNYKSYALPAGNYKLYFSTQWYNPNYSSEWYNDKSSFETADTVGVTVGQTTSGINAQLSPIGISVISPNGGENWKIGTTQTIRWSYTGNPGANVKIEILKGGAVKTITPSASIGNGGEGSYNVKIPKKTPIGNDYKIRVTSTSNGSYTDTSDNYFTISK